MATIALLLVIATAALAAVAATLAALPRDGYRRVPESTTRTLER